MLAGRLSIISSGSVVFLLFISAVISANVPARLKPGVPKTIYTNAIRLLVLSNTNVKSIYNMSNNLKSEREELVRTPAINIKIGRLQAPITIGQIYRVFPTEITSS